MSAPKVKNPESAKDQGQFNTRSTATEIQLMKLLALLRRRPRHTHELRAMGISHPAGRVQDLLKRGYQIESGRINTVDSDAFTHSGVALYTLVGEPNGGK